MLAVVNERPIAADLFNITPALRLNAGRCRNSGRIVFPLLGVLIIESRFTYQRMLASGVRFRTAPKHCGGPETDGARKLGFTSTYGRDYFGNVFELIEINADSAVQAL
jgi:hypothetical protein